MRQAIGSAWLLQLMIIFILLFTAFLTVTINYTKAFRVKNEVLDFIERGEGLTSRTTTNNEGSIQLINNYLDYNGYFATGKCKDNTWYGVDSLSQNTSPEQAEARKEYHYCVKKMANYDPNHPKKAYYEVEMFFDFNLPIFGDLLTFKVRGVTTQVHMPADCDIFGGNCNYSSSGSGTNSGSNTTRTYTVTFNSGGGSSVAKQTVVSGQTATVPANPTRTGYTFNGWKLNGADYNFNTPITSNITLTANWIANLTSLKINSVNLINNYGITSTQKNGYIELCTQGNALSFSLSLSKSIDSLEIIYYTSRSLSGPWNQETKTYSKTSHQVTSSPPYFEVRNITGSMSYPTYEKYTIKACSGTECVTYNVNQIYAVGPNGGRC